MGDSPSVCVVLPAGEDSPLLRDCLAAVREQEPPVAEIVVVDDTAGRTLGSIEGATVVPSPGRGPYAARNAGWRSTGAEVVLFLDVRSRPRPDWARRLAAAFTDPEVAIAGSDVVTRGGTSVGARAGERHQFFRLEKYMEEGFYRPYFPTCNLAVRRDDLVAVDGFRETRSGADADLCWRILARPGRRLEAVDEALMEWVPRDTVRGYLEQSYRYGASNRGLRAGWSDAGAPQREPLAWSRLAPQVAHRALRLSWVRLRGDRDALVRQLSDASRVAFELGFRLAGRRKGSGGLGPDGVP